MSHESNPDQALKSAVQAFQAGRLERAADLVAPL
jgi:hypothetical protein